MVNEVSDKVSQRQGKVSQILEKVSQRSDEISQKAQQTLDAVLPSLRRDVRKNTEWVLSCIGMNTSATISEIARNLNISAATVKNAQALLKEVGILFRVGSDQGGHWLVVWKSDSQGPSERKETAAEKVQETTLQTTLQTTPRTAYEGLSEVEARLVGFVRQDASISRKELAARLGMTLEGVKYHLKALRAKVDLHHEGPTKNGCWVLGEQKKGGAK